MRSSALILVLLWVFLVATSQEADAIEATEKMKKIMTIRVMKEIMAIKQKNGMSPRKKRDLMDHLPSNSKVFQSLLPVQVNLTGISDHLEKKFKQNMTAFKMFQTLPPMQVDLTAIVDHLEKKFEHNFTAFRIKIEQLEKEVESLKHPDRPSPTSSANQIYGSMELCRFYEKFKILPFKVSKPEYCYNVTEEFEVGGYTLIQMNKNQDENFSTRGWDDYKKGFGGLGLSSTYYWRGLEWLHNKTKCGKWRIKLLWKYDRKYFKKGVPIGVPKEGVPSQTEVFDDFKIDSESFGYRLHVGKKFSFFGLLGSGFNRLNGHKFATFDRDDTRYNCSKHFKGGWWFIDALKLHNVCFNCYEVDNGSGGWNFVIEGRGVEHNGVLWNWRTPTTETYMGIRQVSGKNCN